MSNSIKDKFKNISKNFSNLNNKKFYSKKNIKKLIYFTDKDTVSDILLFSKCVNIKIKDLNIDELLDFVEVYKVPKFPISGDDLKKHGYESGRELGKRLKKLEAKWIEDDFVIDKRVIKKFLGTTNEN